MGLRYVRRWVISGKWVYWQSGDLQVVVRGLVGDQVAVLVRQRPPSLVDSKVEFFVPVGTLLLLLFSVCTKKKKSARQAIRKRKYNARCKYKQHSRTGTYGEAQGTTTSRKLV